MTQRSRSLLNSAAVTNLADNISGQISAADVRDLIRDIADSTLNQTTDVQTPEAFGAVGDGVTDDTAAIQAAIDYFGDSGSGTVFLPHGYLITDTIVNDKAVLLRGAGAVGRSANTIKSGFIKWGGVAGVPMIKIEDTFGAGVENIRLIGKSSAKPSYAIEFSQSVAAPNTLFYGSLRNVWIGELYGLDSDSADQFVSGIGFTGTVNGDSFIFDNIRITGCTEYGVDVLNPNASALHWNGLYIQNATTGYRSCATASGSNVFIGGSTAYDIELCNSPLGAGAGRLFLTDFTSESSAAFFTITGASCKLVIRGGSWQAQSDALVRSDNVIALIGENKFQWLVHLEDFQLQFAADYTGVPKFKLHDGAGNISVGSVRLINTLGIEPINLDFGTMIQVNDARDVVYQPTIFGAYEPAVDVRWHGNYDRAAERAFRVHAQDRAGEWNQYGGPFNVRALATPAAPTVTATVGSGATTYSYRVSALTHDGETLASTAGTCTNAATLDSSHKNRVDWLNIPGARAYKVYGRTGASEVLITTIAYNDFRTGNQNTTSMLPYFVDDGSLTPSGALPTVNTTGNGATEGAHLVGTFLKGAMPSASPAGRIIYVSDETGGAVLAFSDATNWRRVTDRAIVS